jgi:NodT family efflux transporter outer membrane factor (OMF) lipoprotein
VAEEDFLVTLERKRAMANAMFEAAHPGRGRSPGGTFTRTVAAAALLAVLAGCATTPAFQRPDVPLPSQWQGATTTSEARAAGGGATTQPVSADWWKHFGSAELDELMAAALANNHDLAAAVSRIEQARAAARIAGAARLPNAQLSAGASGSRRSNGGESSSSDDQAAIVISWELDLWGGKAQQARAADARVAANAFDRDAVGLLLQSEVATNYFQALALKDRRELARANLDAARQLLSLIEIRYQNGAATGLEVAQQRASTASLEAQLPALEQDLRVTQNALAVLLGRPPQGFAVRGESLRELALPAVDAGAPAALLERRPDIRRSEARLVAANADIGAARAALYPSVNLSISAGVSGLLTGGSSTVAALVGSLAQTLFDGGRLRGQVDQVTAQRTELVSTYAQTVLNGLREVEDALVRVAATSERIDRLSESAAQAREAYRLATIRYREGAEDLLTVLDSQRSQLQAEDGVVQAELARHVATTDLFKALGGGWEAQPLAVARGT